VRIAQTNRRSRPKRSPLSHEPLTSITQTDRVDHAKRLRRSVTPFSQVTVNGRVGHKTRKISRSRKWLVVSLLDAAQTAFVTSLASDRAFRNR
jgi:hypothetical protein